MANNGWTVEDEELGTTTPGAVNPEYDGENKPWVIINEDAGVIPKALADAVAKATQEANRAEAQANIADLASTLTFGEVEMLEPEDDPYVEVGPKPTQIIKLFLPRGFQGIQGNTPVLAAGTFATGEPGSTVEGALTPDPDVPGRYYLSLTVPEGLKGDTGDMPTLAAGVIATGAPGSSVAVEITPDPVVVDQYLLDLTIPRGDKGDTGEVPTFVGGTITTGAPGSSASATVTPHESVPNRYRLNLTIPRGDVGDVGPPPELTAGTMTTGAPGSSFTATLTPTGYGSYALNLTVPRGDKGDAGNMSGANNLSELTNTTAARTNLGLGALAVKDKWALGDYTPAADTAFVLGRNATTGALAEVLMASAATANSVAIRGTGGVLIVGTPTTTTHATTKAYVDTADAAKVTGPAAAVADRIAVFDGTTGKLVKDGGSTIANINSAIAAKADTTSLTSGLAAKVDSALIGVANGIAPLAGDGKISTSFLPASVLGAMSYQGTWDAATNSPAIPAAAAGNKGHYYKVGTAGTTNVSGITDWQVGDWIVSSGIAWDKIDNTDLVSSVAGLTGVIGASALKTALGITTGDVSGLSAALAGKSDTGHTHDDRYYTETEVNSLLSGKQNSLGYTPANKAGDTFTGSVNINGGLATNAGSISAYLGGTVAGWSTAVSCGFSGNHRGYITYNYATGDQAYTYLVAQDGTISRDLRVGTSGNAWISGTFYAGAKSFLIDHPLDPTEKDLRHVAVEAPEFQLRYRGRVKLIAGQATINIDEVARMTPGTFVALAGDAAVYSAMPIDSFERVKVSEVVDGEFIITSENPTSTADVAWEVAARRVDPFVFTSTETDENGMYVPEIDKPEIPNASN